jgi:hypothetical protein
MVSSSIVQTVTGLRIDESLYRAGETLQKETSLEIQLALAALIQAQEQRRTLKHLRQVEATRDAVLDVAAALAVTNATDITNLAQQFQANIDPFMRWQEAVQKAAEIYQDLKNKQVATTQAMLARMEAGTAAAETMAENYIRSTNTAALLAPSAQQ